LTSTLPSGYTTALLVTEGTIMIGEKIYHHGDMLHFSKSGETLTLTGAPDTKVLLMAGEPLGEPIAHYGPFVMNTQREIEEAIADFNAGKFENK
jgi:quercetin 2,3-dioxygenase